MSLDVSTPPSITGYLLLFRGTNWENYGLSEAGMRESLEKVKAWFDRLAASGKLVGAQPLMHESVTVTGKNGSLVTDGPFAEAKEAIGGYVLLSVDSMEEAVEIAKGNPMHEYGLNTEIRPTASNCPYLFRLFNTFLGAGAAAA